MEMKMSSPTNSQNQAPISPPQESSFINDIREEEQQNPPQSDDPQSPKTLTLEIPDTEVPNSQDPRDDDPNQDDPEDVTPVSPTIYDPHVSSTSITATFSISRRGVGGGGGGPKRKKRHAAQQKKTQKMLDILGGTLNPIPFVPIKTLDFSSHEALLKRLGLWDFVHLQFDVNLRDDLIAQLIVDFSPSNRRSYVNGCYIKVSRADLARALKLPVKLDKDNAVEVKESEESIGFIQDFVSTWLLLHEDTWMMTGDIFNMTKLIKEGNFEKVDWAKLVWLMVEKELSMGTKLGNCYYASHLQLLMKSQKEELFREEPAKMDIDVKENEEEDVRMSEELRGGSELEEHTIELSLGGLDNAVKVDDDKEGKEQAGDDDAMDFEESKEDEEQGQWMKSSMDGHFLRRCDVEEVGVVECEERKQEEEEGEEEGKDEEDGEEEEEVDFNISPKGDNLEGVSSENLIAVLETAQIPFSSGVQIHDNVSSGDFLASRVDTQTIPGTSSLFSNGNGNKREIEHFENDMPLHALNGGSKRMRSDGHWDLKSSSDFDMYMEQMQHVMGKARMLYEAKEQACQEMNMHQQMLLNELQQRSNMIQHLHKVKMEEQQKRQVDIYRLERELYMMGNLLEGYRKALKETHKAFAEYRAKCPLPEEPIYKDTGSGGLVLSTMELEKQRLKQEEEERQNRLLIEKKVKDFEAGWITKFEAHKDGVELLGNTLLEVGKEFNLLKERIIKSKVSEIPESVPAEE